MPDDHDCGWKGRAGELEQQLGTLKAELEALKRRVLGPKSEKLPSMAGEVAKKRPPNPAAAQATRRKNAELRATCVATEDVQHKVPAADRKCCPKCKGTDLRPVGVGKESIVVDYVPGYFRRRRHLRETLACTCGKHIVVAPGPEHSVEVRATATASALSWSPRSAPTRSHFIVRPDSSAGSASPSRAAL